MLAVRRGTQRAKGADGNGSCPVLGGWSGAGHAAGVSTMGQGQDGLWPQGLKSIPTNRSATPWEVMGRGF